MRRPPSAPPPGAVKLPPAAAPAEAGRTRKHTLTEDDRQVWRQVTGSVTPLHPGPPEPLPPAPKTQTTAVPAPPPDPLLLPRPPQGPAPVKASRKPRPLVPGEMVDLDASTARRFARGNMAIDATLDLHGMGAEAAFLRLRAFITAEQARGSRCVLVITGKGGGGPRPWIDMQGEDRGILRRALPHWLNESGSRARVLAITAAKGHHGGAGAYYLLLKRQRSDTA